MIRKKSSAWVVIGVIAWIAIRPAGVAAQAPSSSPVQPPAEASKPSPREFAQDKTIEVRTRIHPRWEMRRRDGGGTGSQTENSFRVRRARLKVIWRPTGWVRGVLQIGAEEVFELGQSLLKDAYLHFSPSPYLQLRMGQFKKPFSGLERRSPKRLRTIERGEGNELIVEDLTFGDRDIGVQLSGRLIQSLRLDYSVGVFNGTGPNFDDQDKSKDVVGRSRIRPLKSLAVGLNASLKLFENTEDNQVIRNDTTRAVALGADLRFKLKGFRLHLEGLFAEDHLYKIRPNTQTNATKPDWIFNAVGVLSYRHELPVSWRFAVEPVVKAELLDPNTEIVKDEVLVLGPGINSYFGKYTRLLVHGEFRNARRNAEAEYPDWFKLMVQLCLDI